MTSLSQQLKQLKVPQSNVLLQDKRKPSLLFDPREAATLDRETVLNLGQKGLQELIALCDLFKEFEKTLFAHSSLSLERSVRDTKENEKLDREIEKFLILLSPYFLINSAHKALEWLIHRFHIHWFNKDHFLLLILPYHETRLFVRALQLVDISSTSDKWNWLSMLQKPGLPLPLSSLIKQICKDNGLLKLICNHVITATKVYSFEADKLSTLYAFFSHTLIGLLVQCSSISEVQLNHILAALIAGISSSVINFNAGAYMILAKLITRIRLTESDIDNILRKLLKRPILKHEALLLFLYMFENPFNCIKSISYKLILRLAKSNWFIDMLIKIKLSGFKISNFLYSFFEHILQFIGEKSRNYTDSSAKDMEKVKTLLNEFILKVSLTDKEINVIFKFAMKHDLTGDNISKDTKIFLQKLFKNLERKYPIVCDDYLRNLIKCYDGEKIEENTRHALSFFMSWHSGASDAEISLDILSKLNHYSAEQRIIALKMIADDSVQVNESLREIIINALLARFDDHDYQVVYTLLSVPLGKLNSFVRSDILMQKLIVLISECHMKNRKFIAQPALKMLLQLCEDGKNTNVFLTALPYLFPSGKKDVEITKQVLNSEFAKTNIFMRKIRENLDNYNDAESICCISFSNILKRELLPSTEDILSAMKQQISHGDAASLFFHMILLGSICRVEVGSLPTYIALEVVEIVAEILVRYRKIEPLPGINQLNGNEILTALQVTESGVLPLQVVTYVLEMVHRRLNLNVKSKLDFENDLERSHLIHRLLEIIFSGLDKAEWSQHYKWCLDIFLKRHFSNTENTIRFFSHLFVEPVKSNISLHCLRLTLEQFDRGTSVQWIFQDKIFVPNLLLALSQKDTACREVAVKIVKKLAEQTFNLSKEGFSVLLQELAKRHVEISVDSEQLPLALYMLLSPDPDVNGQHKAALKSKLKEARELLFSIIIDENVPVHVTSQLLRILTHVNSSEILTLLTPLGYKLLHRHEFHFAGSALKDILLRFNSNTVDALLDDQVWQLFETCLSDTQTQITWRENEKRQLLSVIAMKQIDEMFFACLDERLKKKILNKLVDILTHCEIGSVVSMASRVIRRICIDAQLIVAELENMQNIKLQETRGKNVSGRRSRVNIYSKPEIINSDGWKRGITLLEFIQDADNLRNEQCLITLLFDLLRLCLNFEEQSPVEYTNQLILSTLHRFAGTSVLKLLKNAHQHIGLIAQCMRTSHNPQTHHHALLLLVELFKIADVQNALHQVLPIFTFMGNSVLRQDDAYSIQIISKTIETIIPIINVTNSEEHACEVLRIFVTTLPDIPEHRRMPLFTKLLQLMDKHLHLYYLLSFESHVRSQPKIEETNTTPTSFTFPLSSFSSTTFSRSRRSSSQRLDFTLQMSQQFPPKKLFEICIKLIEFFKDLPNEIDGTKEEKAIELRKRFPYNHVFDVANSSLKEIRHMKYVIIQFLNALLSSSDFINRIAKLTPEEVHDLCPLYDTLIVKVILLIQSMTTNADVQSSHPKSRYWKALLYYLYDVLEVVNNLLPNKVFLITVKRILDDQSPLIVRRKVLELLNSRLQQKLFTEDNHTDLLSLTQPLLELLKDADACVNQEVEVVQQTALISLKLLAKLLTSAHRDVFIEVLELTTEILKKRKGPVLASAALCVAELCSSLGPYAVKLLNTFFPVILQLLDVHYYPQEVPDVIIISIVSALHKIVESICNFISKDDLDQLLLKLCKLNCSYTNTEHPKIEMIVSKLKLINQKLSNSIPLRVLLPAVDRTYDMLLKSKSVRSIGPLMNILAESLTDIQPVDLNPLIFNSKEQDLITFFLKILDFRMDILKIYTSKDNKTERNGELVEETDNKEVIEVNKTNIVCLNDLILVEESASKALVALVLKLSETTFRPFYYKLYDWAAKNPSKQYRNITFYRLSANIAECLKSLFVIFAGHFLKHAAALLTSCNIIAQNATKGNEENVTKLDTSYKIELTEAILLTLMRTFSYDAHDFVNQERFDVLIIPLVDQIENTLGGKANYEKRVQELIVPCIAAFAGAIADDTLHKQLIYHVLLKTKHEDVNVRIAALSTLVEIVRKLGEDFMPLLPETIPVLSELQEDEDMEKYVHNAIWTLEELLGEPLQKYL